MQKHCSYQEPIKIILVFLNIPAGKCILVFLNIPAGKCILVFLNIPGQVSVY